MKRKVVLIGDSHVQALKLAIREQVSSDRSVEFSAYRVQRIKGQATIGDLPFGGLLELVSNLGPDDLVVSVFAGNQHQLVGLVQHPVRFDFSEPGSNASLDPEAEQVIPYRVLWDLFLKGARMNRMRHLDRAFKGRMYHVAAPPPKQNVDHILKKPESAFVAANIAEMGVSSHHLRSKLWRLQNRAQQAICADWGIGFVAPPEGTVTEEGCLFPEYYASDATHANVAYGHLVLDQLEKITLENRGAEEVSE